MNSTPHPSETHQAWWCRAILWLIVFKWLNHFYHIVNSLSILTRSLTSDPVALATLLFQHRASSEDLLSNLLGSLLGRTPTYVQLLDVQTMQDVWKSPLPDTTRAYLSRLVDSVRTEPDSWWGKPLVSTVASVVDAVQWFGLWDVETMVARANVHLIAVNVELTHLFRQRDLLLKWSVCWAVVYLVVCSVRKWNVKKRIESFFFTSCTIRKTSTFKKKPTSNKQWRCSTRNPPM